jgi:putative flippase GtrA
MNPQLSLGTQLWRFVVTGGFSAVVDYGLYILLNVTFGVQLDLAKTAGWVVGTTSAYLLNRRWTFQAPPSTARLAAVWALYITTFVVQVGINHVMVAALEDSWWRKPLAFVVAQGTATVINFVVQRAVIFRLR